MTNKPTERLALPTINGGAGKAQTLQEWHAAGGGVPLSHKHKPHVWKAKVARMAGATEGGLVQIAPHFQVGGVAKGIKALVKAALKPSEVLPMAEANANLAKMLEPSAAKMRLYHGTTATEGGKGTEAIRSLKPSKEGALGSGVYTTPKADFGSTYAEEMGGNVLPVHVQIKNPLILRGSSEPDKYKDPMIEALELLGMDTNKASKLVERAYEERGYIGKQVQSRAQAQGYDGIMQYDRNGDLSEVVSYNPNAIKSAIGNQGSYDITHPDLSKAQGGLVHMADGGDPRGEMRATPRNQVLGAVADAIKGGHEFVSKPFGYRNPPAEMVSEFLGIPAIGRTVNRLSYGEPITNAGVANVPLVPSDLGETAMTLAPFVPAGARMAVKGAKAAGRGALQAVEKGAKNAKAPGDPYFGGPLGRQRGVVKLPGGNFPTGGVDAALRSLRTKVHGGMDPAEELRKLKERYTPEEISTWLLRDQEALERSVALNNWVDRNLSNYVKKQMATPEDPVRKLAEEGITHKPGIVEEYSHTPPDMLERRQQAGFPPEGMGQSPTAQAWERASDNAIGSVRAGDIQEMPEKVAKYEAAKKKMEAARETLDDKVEQRLKDIGLNERDRANLIQNLPYGEKGRMVEFADLQKAADEMYLSRDPNMEAYLRMGKENPYISKLDPETPLYQPYTYDLGYDHIMDVLREDVTAGRIRPEQLQKLSMEQAVRRTYEYDQEMLAKMNAANAARREGLPVHKEYPEGYRWIQLNKPGSFASESDAMGHSVRGYEPPRGHPDWVEASGDSGSPDYGLGGWEAIKSGRAKVYSLVDEKGAPHTTIEVLNNNPYPVSGEAFAMLSPAEKAQHREHVMQWRRRNPDIEELTDEHTTQALKEAGVAPAPGDIKQIKGKVNLGPKDEYLPYVQDFVTSGNWNRVGDAHNAGMRHYNDVFNVEEQRAIEAAGERVPDHEYLTGADIQRLHNSINPEGKRLKYDIKGNIVDDEAALPPSGMAHGGEVHMQVGGAVKAGTKALLKLFKAGAKLSPEELEILKARDLSIPGVHFADPLALPTMPMSEALGNAGAEGKRLHFTETDRSRVHGPNLGGTGFSGLQHYSKKHKNANAVWALGNKETADKKIAQNNPETSIWTPYAGSPTQHKSNSIVVNDAVDTFQQAQKAGNVHPEQTRLINERIRSAVSDAGNPLFPTGFDITDPQALKYATTFDRRTAISNALLGEGVKKPMLSVEFKKANPGVEWKDASNINAILARETDPALVNANTFDVGTGLFMLDNGYIFQPDLNIAFPHVLTGADTGFRFPVVPIKNAAPDFMKKKGYGPNDPVNAWAMSRGMPTQEVTEDYLTGLQKAGFKDGGVVHMDEGGAALGVFPQMKGTRQNQDREAAKHIPIDVVRGLASGVLGAPGGIEGLVRMIPGLERDKKLSDLITNDHRETYLPTSEEIEKRIPFRGEAPVNKVATGIGTLLGGFYTGPGAPTKLAFQGAKAVGRGAGALASKGIDAIKVKPKNMASSDTLAPLVTEVKTASAGKPTGVTYATKQEGPFYRVRSTALDPSDVSTRGFRETTGSPSSTAVEEGAATVRERLPQLYSDEELARLIENNQPLQIAKQYTKEQHGTDYGLDKALDSSLAKQSAIGRTHMLGVEGSPEYKTAIFDAYSRQMPDVLEKANAKNYDDLLEKAYRQLGKETDDQFHRLPVSMSYHRAGEGNYAGANDMAKDVHGNRHLYVFQGGEPHDFLNNADSLTGLNENEKFRAVHDFFGHAIHRNQFGPKGEEHAWNAHRQMYSPLAQLAMTIETRGQNSLVNYTPLNAKLKDKIAKLKEVQQEFKNKGDVAGYEMVTKAIGDAFQGFQFAPQKAILLPPEFISPKYQGGMPDYVKRLITPEKGTETQSALTHFSNEPNLLFTDPTKYGTGIKGAEAERLSWPGAVRDRSHFYLGEPESVMPEANLGVNRYRGESSSLYDLGADPLDFKILARESNRTPFEAKSNKGVTYPDQDANDIERLVKEYGYEGMANPNTPKPMAIMFDQVPVERRAKGGLASIK